MPNDIVDAPTVTSLTSRRMSPWIQATTENGGHPMALTEEGYFLMSYTRLKASPDLTYTVEVSGDLQTWNSGVTFMTQTSLMAVDSAREKIIVRGNSPITGPTSDYMRLRVTKP